MTDHSGLLPLLQKMRLIRAFEEKVVELAGTGELYGHIHVSIGQEAVPVGISRHLREDDYVTSNHRGHGHLIAKGGDPGKMLAELYGKKTGYCKGKGGSMHVAAFEKGIIGANGIVGAGAPHAVGAAMGFKLDGSDRVVVSFFGDAALNQGAVHEAMNLAAIWKLPVIFVCENNRYGITTAASYHLSGDMKRRGEAYGMASEIVDGMDVLKVSEAAERAVERARAGEGPSFLGCETYRFRGHTEGEEVLGWKYRTAEEVEEWKQRDPIVKLEQHLLENQLADRATLDQIEAEVRAIIERAGTYGQESPEPELYEALEDVFSA